MGGGLGVYGGFEESLGMYQEGQRKTLGEGPRGTWGGAQFCAGRPGGVVVLGGGSLGGSGGEGRAQWGDGGMGGGVPCRGRVPGQDVKGGWQSEWGGPVEGRHPGECLYWMIAGRGSPGGV